MEKHCPECGKQGLAVGIETVKALLKRSLREIDAALIYRFCAKPDCAVVYFAYPDKMFSKDDLSVSVYQKEPPHPDTLICYCFQHRLKEFDEADAETIIQDIQAGITAQQCACELRNPQGNCCLGNVLALLKKPKATLG